MTLAVIKLFDKLALTGCPVVTSDLATDIILSIAPAYLHNNHSPLKTSNIRDFSLTWQRQEVECLAVRIECDDDRTYEVVYDMESIDSYRRHKHE